MRIKPQIAFIVSILILIAGIALTSMFGLWTTESTKVPQKFVDVTGTEQYDPADIRGSYTFGEISSLFNVPLEDLAEAFHVEPGLEESFKCKDLETVYTDTENEIGTSSVRMFVAMYINLPYEMTGETFLPDTAVAILMEKADLSAENLAYLESHIVKVS